MAGSRMHTPLPWTKPTTAPTGPAPSASLFTRRHTAWRSCTGGFGMQCTALCVARGLAPDPAAAWVAGLMALCRTPRLQRGGAGQREAGAASGEDTWQRPACQRSGSGVGEGRGHQGRHHRDGSIVPKEVRRAVVASGMAKPASCHTFRHSFATPRHTEPRRSALGSQGHL
jgi:hypothetical protein